jgi:uncharacterized protein YggE
MMFQRSVAVLLASFAALPASAQNLQPPLDQLAATPLVTVHISEQLRSPPDQATISASTEATEPTATAALAADKVKTERLLQAIPAAGIAAKDVQTEGVSVGAEYTFEPVNGRSSRRLLGYTARNSVRIKTRQIDRLASLLDALTAAGASSVYGPQFSIADPAPLRAEARRRAMARGEAEATEYARNAGFARVQLLSVEEGVSYHGEDIIVSGSRINALPPAPPPPPPPGAGERDQTIQPGQIENGVSLTLRYRMQR